jgi:hypothetical protein
MLDLSKLFIGLKGAGQKLVYGSRKLEKEVADYPLPCAGCNAVFKSHGIRFENVVTAGFVEIHDGRIFTTKHVINCSSSN